MLSREYMQLALLAGLLVGAVAPLVGTFVVHRRLALVGDGLGHVAFAGVALGALLSIDPFVVGLVLTILGAIAIDEIRRRLGASGDLALAILFYSGLALGVVFASMAPSLDASLASYLFGSILTVTGGDLALMAGIAVVVVITVALLRGPMFTLVLGEDVARASGLPVTTLNRVMLLLVALVVGLGMRVVGVLLVASLLVLPVATAQVFARSFDRALALGSVIGAIVAVAGLTVSYYADLAPGGTIVLTAVVAFLVVAAAGRLLRIPGRARLDQGDAALPPGV